jgi:hypothetical protein
MMLVAKAEARGFRRPITTVPSLSDREQRAQEGACKEEDWL